ncbi:hypothetical protein [Parabacteroides goldsteinii]|uniref:hypothetical protein n=1 Tax=Parabacteroides goldsteinii TaxID=328812 RepID=UPI0002F771EF|nr:hypothetical protein [Parabacteroides goldsteinii]
MSYYKERIEHTRFSCPSLSLQAQQGLEKWKQEAGGLLERALRFTLPCAGKD